MGLPTAYLTSSKNLPAILEAIQQAKAPERFAGPGLTASTVSNDPNSKRYHPNLYRKLAHALREAGASAPEG